MNCITKEELHKWSKANEESLFFYPIKFNHTCRKHYQWYEREPREWFKPFFELLLLIRNQFNNTDLYDELVSNTIN